MTGVFEFFWGFVWGASLCAAVIGVKKQQDKVKWRCPDCNIVAEGSQEFIDYVVLEHGQVHE